MITKADVTVVMPAYNAGKYIQASIRSILDQTYKDFVLMVINDGSSDDTEQKILDFQDRRIQYVKNEQNIGLVKTLNKSIDLTSTEFYARMDADDIALPDRLKIQMDFMRDHPEVGVCGTSFRTFGHENRYPEIPLEDSDIKASLLFSCQILHPSVVIRTEILKKNNIKFGVPFNYDDPYGHKVLELEDYALWHKLKGITTFHNLKNVLIEYRVEGQNLTTQKMDQILERKKQYYRYLLKELDIVPSDKDLLYHISLKYFNDSRTPSDVTDFKAHLDLLLQLNFQKKLYNQHSLEKVVRHKWNQLFYYIVPKGFAFIFEYLRLSRKFILHQLMYLMKYWLRNPLKFLKKA